MRVRLVTTFAIGLALASCGGGGSGGGAQPPAGLSYADASPSYAACAPIQANLPALASGSATSFAIDPALPPGLALDAASGAITGTPSALATSATYVVTAANSAGSARATLTLEVVANDPGALDYGSSTLDFAFGVESSYSPSLASGVANDWSVVAGSLPAGVTLDPATGVLSGKPPHSLAPGASAVTIRASNCTGANTSVALSLDVERPAARAAYALCDGEALISSYVADRSSGLLWSRGADPTADSASGELAVTPDGEWLVVSEGDYAALRTFACDRATGRLSDTGVQVSSGAVPATALAVHPSSGFVYASTADGFLLGFALDGETGALTATSPASVAIGGEAAALAMDPFGRFLFVATALDARVEAFRVDSATGALTSAGSVATGDSPASAAVSADGAWLFVSNGGDASVGAFSIHPASGALAPIAGSPFATPGGSSPSQLAAGATGEHLYVLHAFDAAIDAFSVAANGTLAPLASPTTALERPASRLVLDPSGSLLYALVDGRGWFAFAVGGDGALSEAATERIVARPSSRALAFQPGVVESEVAATQAYVASADGNVFQFSIASGGSLAALSPASVAASVAVVRWVEPHPRLPLALVATAASTPARYSIDGAGALTLVQDGTASSASRSIHFDPSGRYAFEVQDGASPLVQPFAVDQGTGALAALTPIDVSAGPGPLAMHPAGRFLYVPCSSANSIDVLEIDWATGELIPWPSAITGGAPTRLAVTESGSHVLCVESATSTVAVYAVDPLTGALEVLPGSFNSVGAGAVELAADPSGDFVFVAGAAGDAVRAFALDAGDGSLTDLGFAATGSTPNALRVDPSGQFLFAARANGTLARIAFDSNSGFSVVQSLSAGVAQLQLGLRGVVR